MRVDFQPKGLTRCWHENMKTQNSICFGCHENTVKWSNHAHYRSPLAWHVHYSIFGGPCAQRSVLKGFLLFSTLGGESEPPCHYFFISICLEFVQIVLKEAVNQYCLFIRRVLTSLRKCVHGRRCQVKTNHFDNGTRSQYLKWSALHCCLGCYNKHDSFARHFFKRNPGAVLIQLITSVPGKHQQLISEIISLKQLDTVKQNWTHKSPKVSQ